MTVVAGVKRILFCEGQGDPDHPSGLDTRLLNRLLQGKPPGTVIQPAGGKYQMRAFIRGRLAGEGAQANYLAFRDRDFDAQPTPDASLIPFRSGQPIYMPYRAAVENYLIDASLIDNYWNEQSTAPNWKHGPCPGVGQIASWIDEAADLLIAYQATRWALASLKPGDRWPEISTTWTRGSGYLPSSLNEEDCLNEAKTLVNDFRSQTAGVSETGLEINFRSFLERFSAEGFLNHQEYLVWFHGKDLKKAMQKLRLQGISLDHFLGWSVENFDWEQHRDLRELASLI